ncbi:hypothetical protein C809_01332 [Lachnospiraceae bacterium MD335]|nr:hypothetical protein C809_01332 [Lachnospiraceae bacterium MD335]
MPFLFPRRHFYFYSAKHASELPRSGIELGIAEWREEANFII